MYTGNSVEWNGHSCVLFPPTTKIGTHMVWPQPKAVHDVVFMISFDLYVFLPGRHGINRFSVCVIATLACHVFLTWDAWPHAKALLICVSFRRDTTYVRHGKPTTSFSMEINCRSLELMVKYRHRHNFFHATHGPKYMPLSMSSFVMISYYLSLIQLESPVYRNWAKTTQITLPSWLSCT